jgi:hypothetical protein
MMESNRKVPQDPKAKVAADVLKWAKSEIQVPSSVLPSMEDLKPLCRGNMLPIWNFLITNIKSER